MVIEESDFRLTSVNEFSTKWDLELLYTIRPKGKEARTEFKAVAYGLPLESALKRVINFRINNKHQDVISLKDYLKEYKDQLNQLNHLLYG
jgi:hypothetical protein